MDVDREQSITQVTGKKLDRVILVVLALALAYFAFDRFILVPAMVAEIVEETAQQARSDALVESFGDLSIAVLPFVNMSSDPEQEYFSDGISEELLNLLSKIPEMRVISRSSAFTYKDKDLDIPTIAKQLNVAYVLEGSVRKANNQVRITAQLIEAHSDTHLWSRVFERSYSNVFDIQDEIATLVTRQLEVDLLGAVPRVQRTDPEAYSLYLQAKWQFFTEENVASSISKLKQALLIDPKYTPAWVWLGHNYLYQINNFSYDEVTLGLAFSAAENALRLDPYYAPAHVLLGVLTTYINDLQNAARHFERAFEIDPNDETLTTRAIWLLQSLGRFDEAEQLARFAMSRNPLSSSVNMGLTLLMDKRSKEAEQYWRQEVKLNPDGPEWVPLFLAITLAANGKHQEALEVVQNSKDQLLKTWLLIWLYQQMGMTEMYEAGLAEMKQLEGDVPNPNWARFYALLGDADAAFERLDLHEDVRHWNRERYWPVYWPIQHDPRWELFLEKMGVSDAQLAEIEFNFKLPN